MNFDLDESQVAVRDLARDLFSRRVDADRLEKVDATDDRFDRDLWAALAESGLLGVTTPESFGGLGFGAVETALVLEQCGRTTARVPLVSTLVTTALVATYGNESTRAQWLPGLADGNTIAAVAAPASTGSMRLADTILTGVAVGVPWAHVADVVVIPVGADVVLAAPTAAGVRSERVDTTSRDLALTLEFDGRVTALLPGAAAALSLRLRSALAAMQAGICETAVRMAADYTSQREQFGKPLSTFQGVALKAADAYLDAVAIRAAAMQAAWAIDADADPEPAVLTAAWWAAEAGQRCVHLTQHLHGGMGADVTYPVHRHFLAGKQIELMLGGASALLAELGDALAARPDAGDAIVL